MKSTTASSSNRPLNSPVEEIKAKLSIEEVIGSYIKVDRAGANYKAKCPFHNEKTPSFFISPERGSYYCFGCNAKGDIFTFVEQFEGTDFKGALKILADRAGVVLSYEKPSPEALARRSEREALYDTMEAACKYYEGEIEKSGNAPALDYIKSRGISEETRKSFRIGFAPDTWRGLYDALKADKHAAKWSDSLLEKAGLIKRTEKGYYDRFRGRVMFPIFDSSGRVIAFSGRILVDDGKSAKYINSTDTPLYDKSAVLYGIDRAKNEIRLRNFTILVEGQMDLVLSHQAGIKNTVAVSGTALGEGRQGGPGESEGGKLASQNQSENDQSGVSNLALVRRISPQIIIAFDSDKAGRAATLRAARIAIGSGMDVKVAALPDGKDPADIIKENRELWVKALREAKPVTHFLVDTALLETEDKRKLPRILNEKVLPFVAEFNSSMEQAQAVSYISSRTGIPEKAIWDDLGKVKQKVDASSPKQNSGNVTSSAPAVIDSKKSEINKLDIVVRKLFSIIFLEQDNELAKHIESEIKRILEPTKFEELKSALQARAKELAFEAEVSFTKETIRSTAEELLVTLETDQIKTQLTEAVSELSKAEASKDIQKVETILKRCQELNLKLRNVKSR